MGGCCGLTSARVCRSISLFANAVPVGTVNVSFSLPMNCIGAIEGGFAGELQEVRLID